MRPRYFILFGQPGDQRLTPGLGRAGLVETFSHRKWQVWASPDLPIVISDDRQSIILGDVFEKAHPFATVTSLSDQKQPVLGGAEGCVELLTKFWGNYVAILADADSRNLNVARSPFGQLPCYYVARGSATLMASDIALLEELGLVRRSIDWASVTNHLLAPNLRSSATCLSGVRELIGGFGLVLGASEPTLFEAWNPWSFTAADLAVDDEHDAQAMLRSCINGVVAALSRKTRRAVLGISGGLDSSVVAAALATSGTPFSCLTLFTKDPAGDERSFARSLARRLGAELFEAPEDPAQVDVTHSDAHHLPRPVARAFAQSGNIANLDVARQTGADCFYSGGGGDNVFCSLQSAAPVADCLLRGKLSMAWQAASDMARIADCSVTSVVRSGVNRALSGRRTYRWRPELGFLSKDAAVAAPAECMPLWPDAPPGALPGKATHIAFLVGILNHIEGYGRERTHRMVWPLLAQPLVELCLRIPSWLWSRGGINRGLVRRAYADLLPADVLERRTKGTPDCFVAEIFEANRTVIRDFLCDGRLAQHGVLDRERIAKFVGTDAPVRDLRYWRIMALTDVEAWVRSQPTRARG